MKTLAGLGVSAELDGPFETAQFTNPEGLAFDPGTQTLYVADGAAIREVNFRSRKVTTLAGGSTPGFSDGKGSSAQFGWAFGIALEGSSLVVSDRENQRLRRVNFDGVVETIAGNGDAGYVDGTAPSAQFFCPQGVFINTEGKIFVTDWVNYRIRTLSPPTLAVFTFAGSGPVATTEAALWASLPDGGPRQRGKDGPAPSAVFASPWTLAGDAHGNIWIGDGAALRRIDSSGEVVTVAGSLTEVGSVNGAGSEARFAALHALAAGKDGSLFLGDGATIRSVDRAGQVSTIAGAGYGFADGVADQARFASIRAIALDTDTHLFVMDSGDGSNGPLLRELTLQ